MWWVYEAAKPHIYTENILFLCGARCISFSCHSPVVCVHPICIYGLSPNLSALRFGTKMKWLGFGVKGQRSRSQRDQICHFRVCFHDISGNHWRIFSKLLSLMYIGYVGTKNEQIRFWGQKVPAWPIHVCWKSCSWKFLDMAHYVPLCCCSQMFDSLLVEGIADLWTEGLIDWLIDAAMERWSDLVREWKNDGSTSYLLVAAAGVQASTSTSIKQSSLPALQSSCPSTTRTRLPLSLVFRCSTARSTSCSWSRRSSATTTRTLLATTPARAT